MGFKIKVYKRYLELIIFAKVTMSQIRNGYVHALRPGSQYGKIPLQTLHNGLINKKKIVYCDSATSCDVCSSLPTSNGTSL